MEQQIFQLTALAIICFALLMAIMIVGMIWRGQKIRSVMVIILAVLIAFALALYNFRQAAPGTRIEMDGKEAKFKLERDK